MANLVVKNIVIKILFPSGMYEFYCTKQGRFLKFDDLEQAKQYINENY